MKGRVGVVMAVKDKEHVGGSYTGSIDAAVSIVGVSVDAAGTVNDGKKLFINLKHVLT